MAEEKPTKPTKQKRINIEFPKDLEAVYANVAFISHTPAEMIVDYQPYTSRDDCGLCPSTTTNTKR